MTDEERDEINRVSGFVGDAQQALKKVADHAAVLATGRIKVSQARWDEIFAALANARQQVDALQSHLESIARQAGLRV